MNPLPIRDVWPDGSPPAARRPCRPDDPPECEASERNCVHCLARPQGVVVAVDSFGVKPTVNERSLIEALGNVLVKTGMLLPGPMSGPEVLAHAGLFCDDSSADRTRSG